MTETVPWHSNLTEGDNDKQLYEGGGTRAQKEAHQVEQREEEGGFDVRGKGSVLCSPDLLKL